MLSRRKYTPAKNKKVEAPKDEPHVSPKLVSELSFVQKRPDNISYLENPCEKIKLAAVRKFGQEAYQHISEPSLELKIAAVTVSPNLIKTEKFTEEEVLKALVENHPQALQHIDNPSMDIMKIAVGKNGSVIKFIKKPSIEIQLLAVNKSSDNIQHIKKPCKKAIDLAIDLDAINIRFFENPTIPMQMKAVKKNFRAFSYIRNPAFVVQKELVTQNPKLIDLIRNPCEEIQRIAVTLDYKAIDSIAEPTIATQVAALKRAAELNIDYFKKKKNRKKISDWVYNTCRPFSLGKIAQRLKLYLTREKKPANLKEICERI